MLKHIIKYEWKAVSRLLVIVHIAMVAFCALTYLTASNFISDKPSPVGTAFSSLFLILYGLFTMAAAIMTVLIPAIRYFKSMYGNEGYMTHCIPAKTSSLILGREIVYLLWTLIDLACILVPAILFVAGVAYSDEGFFPSLFSGLSYLAAVAGAPLPVMALYAVLWLLVSIVFSNLLVYFAISIGSFFTNHKGVASVIAYLASSFILQVIGFGTLLGTGFSFAGSAPFPGSDVLVRIGSYDIPADFVYSVRTMMHVSIAYLLVLAGFCVLFWFVSWYTADKRLNLD